MLTHIYTHKILNTIERNHGNKLAEFQIHWEKSIVGTLYVLCKFGWENKEIDDGFVYAVSYEFEDDFLYIGNIYVILNGIAIDWWFRIYLVLSFFFTTNKVQITMINLFWNLVYVNILYEYTYAIIDLFISLLRYGRRM